MAEYLGEPARRRFRWGTVLSLLLLLLAGWWLFAEVLDEGRDAAAQSTDAVGATRGGDPEERELARAGADRSAAPSTATSGATLARALAQPQGHFGKSVSGTAVVTRVDSDRGFWVRSGKGETYAVLAETLDRPEDRTRILAGQELRLTGTIHPSAQAARLPELRNAPAGSLLGRAPAFLRVTEVQILEEAAER